MPHMRHRLQTVNKYGTIMVRKRCNSQGARGKGGVGNHNQGEQLRGQRLPNLSRVDVLQSDGGGERLLNDGSLLASMMEHNSTPNACADVAEGCKISLGTKLEVRALESLSISYVSADAPVSERRRALRLQHGFVCECGTASAKLQLAAAGEQRP